MLTLTCKGTPYEIGYTHGAAAKNEIERCIEFYAKMFSSMCKQTWPQVLETSTSFERNIKDKWPRYYEEMKGIADGSDRSILDIISLNIRTEIAFGQFSDGCTSLSYTTRTTSLLGQNWDWMEEQKENLVLLIIESQGFPTIKMVTEAGIIGKIGLNSAGVGVCLNAIRAVGCDVSKMPVHLGLRAVLESNSTKEAVQLLENYGMASSAHFLIADAEEAVGLEFTSSTFAQLPMNPHGRISHTNHLVVDHPEACELPWLPDSRPRLSQIEALAVRRFGNAPKGPTLIEFAGLFADETGFPSSICRAEEGISDFATLFSISMDLKEKRAILKVGRPSITLPGEEISLIFGSV